MGYCKPEKDTREIDGSPLYRLEIELPNEKTDANKTRGMSKFKLYRIHQNIKENIYKLSLGKLPATPLTSFQISVHRFSSKFMDYDNLISSLKPTLDGLRLAKIIEDDKWEYIKNIEVNQTKSKEKKIIITVEETEEMKPKRMATKKEMDSLKENK